MSRASDVARLPALGIAELLGSLGRADSPLITVWMSGGVAVTGVLLRVANDVVMLEDHHQVPGALCTLRQADVVGVRVHHPGRLMESLSRGVVEQPQQGAGPTTLELKRMIAAREGLPLKVRWEAFQHDSARLSLQRLVHDLDQALFAIAREFGPASLAPLALGLIDAGPTPSIVRVEATLRLTIVPRGGAPGRPSKLHLQSEIARLL